MTAPYDLAKAAAAFCPSIRRDDLDALERDLEAEIASIRLFPDAAEVLVTLRERGIKISICSNLAIPYAEPVKRLLPIGMDALSWSFEVGAMKPDPAIYAHACGSLGCVEAEVLMVGDKELEDFSGPMRAGMHALRLRRTPGHSDAPSLPTLKALAALSTAGSLDGTSG
jgi:FMN phosphatase YigB (HAD superfamily)